MLAGLATRATLVIEDPPTIALAALKGRHRHEGPATLDSADDAAGELPETAPGRRALLVVSECPAPPVHTRTG